MEGLNPEIKRKILSDNPNDSTGFEIVRRYKDEDTTKEICLPLI